jgi:hypothetical protein
MKFPITANQDNIRLEIQEISSRIAAAFIQTEGLKASATVKALKGTSVFRATDLGHTEANRIARASVDIALIIRELALEESAELVKDHDF